MTDAAQVPPDLCPPFEGGALYPLHDVPVAVQTELRSQLEAAIAFADYCAFLTAGTQSTQAAQILEGTQALYEATMKALRLHGTPE